ncbi:hypothetical protein EFE42_06005 [Methanohalophilus sp. RSK]|uniref:hypothetical protein n=1 Tax=Methanohalophilus sp. RSK TaxID=2485783 RepID=UPI000F43B859|nr:hypothetical protein [Methanohalophilus sp. RSK]RNI14159.1 hypothetical protein EFE42_06005 [Methanohalophilus sp. RSK]
MDSKDILDIDLSFYYGGSFVTISSIIFVYNADSGLLNEMKDYVHKIVSPASYGCNCVFLLAKDIPDVHFHIQIAAQ